MTKEEKVEFVSGLSEQLNNSPIFYLADISTLDADASVKLRKLAASKGIKMQVVKNSLLKKALEQANADYTELYVALKGNTSIMFAEAGNVPARMIQEFRKKYNKPLLKGAYIEEAVFIGDDQLSILSNIKSREELIGDIVALLQSPAKNVVGALKSGGSTIAGLVKALEAKAS